MKAANRLLRRATHNARAQRWRRADDGKTSRRGSTVRWRGCMARHVGISAKRMRSIWQISGLAPFRQMAYLQQLCCGTREISGGGGRSNLVTFLKQRM